MVPDAEKLPDKSSVGLIVTTTVRPSDTPVTAAFICSSLPVDRKTVCS